MQHHLPVQGASQGGDGYEGLPDPADGPGEDVVELHAVDGVPALLHGEQRHGVTRGHVQRVWSTGGDGARVRTRPLQLHVHQCRASGTL